jgi:hypothetical protein
MTINQFFSNGFIEKKFQLLENSCDVVLKFKKQKEIKLKSKKTKKKLIQNKFEEEIKSLDPKVFDLISTSNGNKQKNNSIEDEVSRAISNFGKHVNTIPSPIKKTEFSNLTIENDWELQPRQVPKRLDEHPISNEFKIEPMLGNQESKPDYILEKKENLKKKPEKQSDKKYEELEEKIIRTNEVSD